MSQQRLAVTFRQLQNKFYSSALMLEKCSGDDLSMAKMTKFLIMIMFLSQAFMTENSVCLWGKWAYTRISVWISDSTVSAQSRAGYCEIKNIISTASPCPYSLHLSILIIHVLTWGMLGMSHVNHYIVSTVIIDSILYYICSGRKL